MILHVEPAARRHRDDVFDKGDGVGLLRVEAEQGTCSSTIFDRKA